MRLLVRAAVLLAALYLLVAAYAGYRVARGIDDAKASSVATRVAARLMGRDALERLAIRRGHVPGILTESPTFWMMLRATE